jgi:acyl-coenzyme A thioesterase PaaI-like protein
MASMVDHTMGTAAQTLAPDDRWVITAELKTSLLRPGKGVKLVCEAVVIKPGRTLSFTEGEVFAIDAQGQRTLVMKASATMALVAKKD